MIQLIIIAVLLVLIVIFVVFALTSYNRFLRIYAKYDAEFVYCNLTGFQFVAFAIDKLNLSTKVAIIEKKLGESYIPSKDIVCISRHTAEVSSVSSICVTAHELGHAVQNKNQSGLFVFQSCLQILSKIGMFLFPFLIVTGIIMLFIPNYHDTAIILMLVALGNLLVVFLFKIFTIPMERQASRIAYNFLKDNNVLTQEELVHAKKVLNAALGTYVAGLILPILRFFGNLGHTFKR